MRLRREEKVKEMYHHELVTPNEGLPIRVIEHRGNESNVLPHWHQAVEIDLVLAGSATYVVGGKTLTARAGDIVLINANEIHGVRSAQSTAETSAVTLLLPYQFLEKQLPNFQFLWFSVDQKNPAYPQLVNAIKSVTTIEAEPTDRLLRLRQQSALYLVLYILLKHFSQYRDVPNNLHGTTQQQALAKIIAFLTDNSRQALTLTQVAGEMHLSIGYLSRLFTKQMQVSLMQYLQLIRLQDAYQLLVTTETSISAIADLTGFASAKAFRTLFIKVYQQNPLKYRQTHKGQ